MGHKDMKDTPILWQIYVKEPSALIAQEKGFALVLLAMAAECAAAPCKPL